jgi:hypothetical protein
MLPAMRYLAAILVALSAPLLFVDCHNPNCDSDVCGCHGGPECILDCGDSDHCSPDCSSFGSDCQATCGDDCVVQCNNGPTCDVMCGANCRINCQSASSCNLTVGDGSTVSCNSDGSCNATCEGRCRVNCTSVGSCNVNCPAGLAKTSCPGGGFACGGPC